MSGLVLLVQVNLRKEPLAEHFRTTVLLCSMASARLDLMVTSETGSGTRKGRDLRRVATSELCFPFHSKRRRKRVVQRF